MHAPRPRQQQVDRGLHGQRLERFGDPARRTLRQHKLSHLAGSRVAPQGWPHRIDQASRLSPAVRDRIGAQRPGDPCHFGEVAILVGADIAGSA